MDSNISIKKRCYDYYSDRFDNYYKIRKLSTEVKDKQSILLIIDKFLEDLINWLDSEGASETIFPVATYIMSKFGSIDICIEYVRLITFIFDNFPIDLLFGELYVKRVYIRGNYLYHFSDVPESFTIKNMGTPFEYCCYLMSVMKVIVPYVKDKESTFTTQWILKQLETEDKK